MKSQITNGGVLLLICESTNSHKSCFYNMLTITSEIVIGGWFVACLLFHLDTFRGRAVTLRSLIYLTCMYIFFPAINLSHVVMERLFVLQCCKRYEKKSKDNNISGFGYLPPTSNLCFFLRYCASHARLCQTLSVQDRVIYCSKGTCKKKRWSTWFW